MASKSGAKLGAIFGDDDYLPLEKMSVTLEKKGGSSGGGGGVEEDSFTLCFWVYLLKRNKAGGGGGGVLIRQGRPDDMQRGVPFLSIDSDRKLTLHPLQPFSKNNAPAAAAEEGLLQEVVKSDQACAMEKWVHFGCEISPGVARIHLNGGVVAEWKASSTSSIKEGRAADLGPVVLSGGDGSTDGDSVQGYAHYVRVLPQPTVTNHYVKNPPLELSLDGSTGASEDHEVEEGGDGVWSVVGGKASCRRNFALDVALLDALGRSIHKEMELVALLVYADTGVPVEKPKDDAEAPLLTTFDGVEFPSTERPIKLVHGRASFKLKISQLSSKCDNRLFRVCFDSPNTPEYPFLRAFSRPIRCVSRNRNHRTPASVWRQKPSVSVCPPEDPPVLLVGEVKIAGEAPHSNGSAHSGYIPLHGSPSCLQGEPPLKRSRIAVEKVVNGSLLVDSSPHRVGALTDGGRASPFSGSQFQRPSASVSPSPSPFTLSSDIHVSQGLLLSPLGASHSTEFTGVKQETDKDSTTHLLAATAMEVAHLSKVNEADAPGFSDFLVYKYCLENMYCRAEFLKAAILSKSDQDLSDFAGRVSFCTGCRHNGYQVLIARRLLSDGDDAWKSLSKDFYQVSWLNLVKVLEEHFIQISGGKRQFSTKDKEFLQKVAGCGDFASRKEFDRLWQWMYPVALALSSPQLHSTWECEDPKWIEGMISRDEAEDWLKTEGNAPQPGSFLLRFGSSRIWPHPDAGALVVSYVGEDTHVHHKLLALDGISGSGEGEKLPLSEILLLQPELMHLLRRSIAPTKTQTSSGLH